MTTTVNNNENKVTVNRIGFFGSFSKFFKEDTQVDNTLFEGGKCYSFAYYIGLNDDCKNGHLTFSFTGEAIQEIEKRRKCKLKIEGKDRVYKQLSKEDCEVLENLYQLGYASNVQKELRDKARKEEQKQKELKEIEDERNKAIAKAQKEYEIKKSGCFFWYKLEQCNFLRS